MDAIELTISSHAPSDALGEIDLRACASAQSTTLLPPERSPTSRTRFNPSKKADDMGGRSISSSTLVQGSTSLSRTTLQKFPCCLFTIKVLHATLSR